MCNLAKNKQNFILYISLILSNCYKTIPFQFLCHFYNIRFLCGLTKTGQMDLTSAKCVLNSISRLIHLVSCQAVKPVPLQKNCNNMVAALRCLKPVLDDVVDYKIPLDENPYRECDELDIQVNEAREFVEKWSPKTSRIHSVSC